MTSDDERPAFRADTTFPYLAFAASRGLDYGEVIRTVQKIEDMILRRDHPDCLYTLTRRDYLALLSTVSAEHARRRAVVFGAAGNVSDALLKDPPRARKLGE